MEYSGKYLLALRLLTWNLFPRVLLSITGVKS